jgi:hypothetical protein
LLTVSAFATDGIHFYFVGIDGPPQFDGATVPGILVLVQDGDGATVCATADSVTTCALAVDDGYGYAFARVNVSAPDNISVYLAGDSVSVDSPVPGIEY